MGCHRLAYGLLVCMPLFQACAMMPQQAATSRLVESQQASSTPVSAPAGKTAEQLSGIDASEPAVLPLVAQDATSLGGQISEGAPPRPPITPAMEAPRVEAPGMPPAPTATAYGDPAVKLASFQGSDDAADPSGSGPPAGNDEAVKLEPVILQTTDRPFPINLATALRLSDARPLIVAAAQASAWVAEARLQRAKVLGVPELDFGAVYLRHDGYGPDFNYGHNNSAYTPGQGGPLNQNINYLYAGGSLYQIVALTDVIFEPLAAQRF